MERFQLLH